MPDELTATFIYRFKYEPKGANYSHLNLRGAAALDQQNLHRADSLMMLDLFFGGVEEEAMAQLTHLEEVVPHEAQRPIVLMPDGTLCELGTDEATGALMLIERAPLPMDLATDFFIDDPNPYPDLHFNFAMPYPTPEDIPDSGDSYGS